MRVKVSKSVLAESHGQLDQLVGRQTSYQRVMGSNPSRVGEFFWVSSSFSSSFLRLSLFLLFLLLSLLLSFSSYFSSFSSLFPRVVCVAFDGCSGVHPSILWSILRGNGAHTPDPDLESFKTRHRTSLVTGVGAVSGSGVEVSS